MSGFTKGPWKWSGTSLEQCETYVDVVSVTVNCGTFCYGGYPEIDVSPHDARLIAAAPDLYEALRVLLDAVLGNHVTVGDCNEARAALAKADGTCAD